MPDRLPLINTGSPLLESYPVKCAVCSHEFRAAPSMLMTGFAINSGSASCPECRTYLHLEIAGDRMNSARYDQYLACIDCQEVSHAQ